MWQRIKPWLGAVAGVIATAAAFVLFAWVFNDAEPMTDAERRQIEELMPQVLRDHPAANDVQQQ